MSRFEKAVSHYHVDTVANRPLSNPAEEAMVTAETKMKGTLISIDFLFSSIIPGR